MNESDKKVTAQEKFKQRLISLEKALQSFEEAYIYERIKAISQS